MKKRTTLRARIVRVNAILMTVALVLVGIGASISSFATAVQQSNKAFKNTVSAAAVAVQMEMSATRAIIQELGMNTTLYDPDVSKTELTEYLRNKAAQYGFIAIYATDSKGINNTGYDLSEYEFFDVAMAGKNYFSEPMLTADGKSAQIMVSAPIWKNGVYGGEVKGAVCAVLDGTVLSNMMTRSSIGETGAMYLVNSEGYTIADVDYNTVLNRENTINEARYDSSLKAFADADRAALNGEAVFDTVIYNDKSQFLYVMPFAGTDWAIGGIAHAKEYVGANLYVFIGTLICSVLLMVTGYFVAVVVSRKFTKPIVAMTEISKQISMGDYDMNLDWHSNDELGDMADNFRLMTSTSKVVIEDTTRVLESIADGDFTVKPKVEYPGVFLAVKQSIEDILGTLGHTVSVIRETAEQVDIGSAQVAGAATSLSQGATEQAAAVEEMAATISQINDQVRGTADNSQTAKEAVSDVRVGIEQSNDRMNRLNVAMSTVSEKSEKIHSVIKIIDDIAFQTNILALNAAVEAARAGQAGKGFAVVADEVRSLALKCANSVEEITPLIAASAGAIAEAVKVANETATALIGVVAQTVKAVEMMDSISEESGEQTIRLNEAATGIEQISVVVQNNSSIAEESAAASEELARQVKRLQEVIRGFNV